MKNNIKMLIKKSKLLSLIFLPVIKVKKKLNDKKLKYYNYFFSNVQGGKVKVQLKNIPGQFEIDARSHILKRILLTKEYEPDITELILKNTDPTKDAINIGANIGLFTNLIANTINANCKVLAIEPTPNAFNLLKTNVKNNGNSEKTILFNGIATNEPGNYSINTISGKEEYSSIGEMIHPAIKNIEYNTIEVIGETIDNLIKKHKLKPGIIVMDVEGAEFSVLKGTINIIDKFKPIIISEIDDKLLNKQKSSSQQVFELLQKTGYQILDTELNMAILPFTGNIIAIPNSSN